MEEEVEKKEKWIVETCFGIKVRLLVETENGIKVRFIPAHSFF